MIFSRWRIIVVFFVLALAVGVFAFVQNRKSEPIETPAPISETGVRKSVIGTSVESRPIEAYQFGSGSKNLLFVGGIHGGYEWNSVLLAYQMIDHFTANPEQVPASTTITIIPSANPDGVFKVIGKQGRFTLAETPATTDTTGLGRFNANQVDLNRNFDCKWKPTSSWRGKTVSAGTHAFSEPEALAIRDFVLKNKPVAVIFWHSQANAVYASECENGILPQTLDIMNLYAKSAGYSPVQSFDAYPVSGDAEGWLASIGIPAITVELSTHQTVEWKQNLAGTQAVINYYSR